MSGTSPGPGHGSANDPAAVDPSMEDILASIRRILSEDEVAAAPGAAEAHPTAGGSGGDDGVLLLDEAMMVEAPPHTSMQPTPPPSGPVVSAAEPDLPPMAAFEHPPAAAVPTRLMAPETEAAAASSVGDLLRTLGSERSTAVYRGGPTIEDLVREEVRPILTTWLDQHLPKLVERLVRAEIERVTGRAGP